jgi:L-alanine-DL-glutamate epimerase-like enolase superfamily enzyme
MPQPASSGSPARIIAVDACGIRIPLAKPVTFSTRRVEARFYTLVRIRTSDGAEGIGLCHAGTRSSSVTTAAVRDLIRPMLIGQDPHRTEGIWAETYQDTLLNGRAGSVMRALSAVDIALWDRNARSCNLPLSRYMGACREETVPAYVSGGYYFPDRSATDWIEEEMGRHVANGFRAIKIKIGGAPPSMDALRVEAARQVVGPDGILLLDANNAWRDLASALRHLEPMMEYHPFFIEEPFSPEDFENHARLAEKLPVPIASGEILAGRRSFERLIAEGGVTIVQADAAVCGGFTEWRKIAGAAESKGLSMAPHSLHDIHIHLVASTPGGLFVEYFPDDSISPIAQVFDQRVEVRKGELVLPERPGLGFDFDENQVAKFAYDGWG